METNGNLERNALWSDVLLVKEPEPTISYRTGWVVYEESLTKGQFVGRGWNGSGFISFYDGRINPGEHATPQAFWIELDGHLLGNDWEWAGFEKTTGDPILAQPSGSKSEAANSLHTVISLRHKVRPVTIKIHTLLDGTPVLTRWLEVTNTGVQPAALAAAFTWSGVLQKTNRWKSHLGDSGLHLYSLGYFENSHWGNEGDFRWHDLPEAAYGVDGRIRRDRHRHPFFVLRNNASGEHFVGQLAWSGGYSFEFDLDADLGTTDQAAWMYFRAGADAPAPQRMVAPGETINLPEMHLGLVFGDLDKAIQAMHDHLRQSVMAPQAGGHGGWVESGIGPEIEITPEQVNHSIEAAAAAGAEVFFIDASWYTPPRADWWATVGDWEVDRQRFPEGLAPFRDLVHQKGMRWGLWMDAERIGRQSRVVKEHPEWIVAATDGQKRADGLLDLANPLTAHWLEEQIGRVITENELDFFRLDHNTHLAALGYRLERDGQVENGYMRYYEVVYGMYARLRQRFPDVIFENCAGGGGRTDIGMVRNFSHTWVTDWQIAPRSFMITNGMTMALPPEYVDRLIGGQAGFTTAEFDFQARLLMFVRPTFAFLYPLGSRPNPLLVGQWKRYIDLYKGFIRPFMSTGRIYHHTPAAAGPDPQGWGVLELAAQDRSRGMAGLFQLAAPVASEYRLRLRGLDAGRRYRVTWDNSSQKAEVDGFTLMNQGLVVRLEGALTSELLLFEAV